MNLMMTLFLFSTLVIGMMPAYLIPKPQETDPQRLGAIQTAITSDTVREIFKGLEIGDGAAFVEHSRVLKDHAPPIKSQTDMYSGGLLS